MNKHPDQSLSIDYYSSSVAFSATVLTFRPFGFNKDQINIVKWKCHIAMWRYESKAKPSPGDLSIAGMSGETKF